MFCQEIFCPGILFPGKFWIRENSKLGTYDSKVQEKRTIKSDLVIGTLNEYVRLKKCVATLGVGLRSFVKK